MENTKQVIGLALVLIGIFVAAYIGNSATPKHAQKYDCSVSEISPDYPLEVKEACRKLRAKAVKKED